MEPELPRRASPGVLPFEEVKPLLCVLLVWTWLTGAGDVVCERSAAAAAAEERLALEARFARNAWAAAVAAADVGCV